MRRFLAIVAAVFMTGLAPATAQADQSQTIVSGLSGSDLIAMLRASGFTVQGGHDNTGRPIAFAEYNSIKFVVRTFECRGEQPVCQQLMFLANFNLGREVTEADYRAINRYNDSNVFGRGYVLESDNAIGVDMVLNVSGGVTIANLASNVRMWVSVLGEFMTELGGASAVS